MKRTVVKIAESQLHVQEEPRGSNAGRDVEKYLITVGLGKGYAWCMAFVYWVVQEAATQKNAVNPLKKTAGVLDQWNNRVNLRVTTPQPGDIFIMDYGRGLGHAGFVTQVRSDGTLETIEGNTDDKASREGYKVARRIRKINAIKGFLRIP